MAVRACWRWAVGSSTGSCTGSRCSVVGLVFYIAMGSTVFLLVALLLAPVLLRPARAARRMLEKAQSTRPDVRNVRFKEQLRGQIISVAEGLQSKVGLAE